MDPLTILSIAASTVQFLDFGSRLLTVAFDSRHGGPSAARVEVNELFEDSQGLTARGKAIEEKAKLLMGLNRPLSITEAALLKESRRCVAASQEISAALGTHVRDQTPQSVLDAISDAFKLVWNEKSIKDSQKRLSDAREKLMFAMVSDLWYEFLPPVWCENFGRNPPRLKLGQGAVSRRRSVSHPNYKTPSPYAAITIAGSTRNPPSDRSSFIIHLPPKE